MNQEKLFSLQAEFSARKNLFINSLIWLPISLAAGVESAIIYLTFSNGQFPALVQISVLTAIVTFLSLIVLSFFNEKLNNKATEYVVYKNRIEYRENFLDSHEIMLLLSDVKEIHLKRSFLQKKFNLGTIRFVTSANTSRTAINGLHTTGINFKDIKNSEQIFSDIKQLIEIKKAEEMKR